MFHPKYIGFHNYPFPRILMLIFITLGLFSNTIGVLHSNTLIVKFDSYVSILDKENRSRYNVDDLLPLVAKVATEFQKIYIELSEVDLREGDTTSLSLSPLAVAKYNNMSSTNLASPLEVWLGIEGLLGVDTKDVDFSRRESIPNKTFLEFQRFKLIADEANEVYNGSVTTFLFSSLFAMLETHEEMFNFFKGRSGIQYVRAVTAGNNNVLLSTPYCIQAKEYNRDVAIKAQISVYYTHPPVTNQSYRDDLPICSRYGTPEINQKKRTLFILSIPDTNGYEEGVNRSRLSSNWITLAEWTNRTGMSMILSQAFDTPYKPLVQERTDGWWSLVEDPKYNSTKDYIFESKMDMIKKPERENNFENISWLQQDTDFKRESTGIILSLYKEKKTNLFAFNKEEMEPIIKKLGNHFSKFVMVVKSITARSLPITQYEMELLNQIPNKVEVVILSLSNSPSMVRLYKGICRNSKTKNITVVIPYNSDKDTKTMTLFKQELLLDKTFNATIKVGRLFSISDSGVIDSKEAKYMEEALKNPDLHAIYFSFEEDEDAVKLGANRMFQQKIVLFEQCRQFLRKLEVNETIEIVFVMMHYATSPELGGPSPEFYQNAWALQNLVSYWEMLSHWAKKENTKVVLNSAIDCPRIWKEGKPVYEIGWWRRNELNGKQEMWSNKREDAYRAAELQNPKLNEASSTLGTLEIILLVVIPLGLAFCAFVAVLFFMKRHYRNKYLTTTEIDYFFLGNQSVGLDEEDENHAQSVPYDKDRFEIDKTTFTIDDGPPLGSGEFGQVCKGKVNKNGESMSIAIKTVNPDKITKTALSGLLSEIKLLAFLGKHENIIQLIGANTADLEDGKVFVFLELCQLGSLEKYLRNLRPTSECSQDRMGFDNNGLYENTTSFEAVTLDQALSDDLYRWAKEICNGMAYLAIKNVVHADLATRNVLLNLRKEVKICDFGLSRRMYNYTNYVKKQKEPLPWKWMSPESLRLMQFNEKSDVWSYGVTLWEIYSLGDSPYQGLSWDANFSRMLELGFRLGEPQFNDRDMYTIMKKCWATNPARRPTFSDLFAEFQE